jgi:predicted metalloendopeptidase
MAADRIEIDYFSTGGGAPSVPSVDPSYSPATDFYNFVNARWQKTVKMPSYEDDYGISEEVDTNYDACS